MAKIDYNAYTQMVSLKLISQLAEPSSKQWRRGQAYFNVLHDVRPDLAKQIQSTALDPFYNDARLPQFCAWLSQHWNDRE